MNTASNKCTGYILQHKHHDIFVSRVIIALAHREMILLTVKWRESKLPGNLLLVVQMNTSVLLLSQFTG